MYIYNDEDNAPMSDHLSEFDFHNPTVYGSRSEMLAVESGKYEEKEEHDNGCWNCSKYNGESCMKNWNNGDEDYYCSETDDHDPLFCCEDWEEEPGIEWEDCFGED